MNLEDRLRRGLRSDLLDADPEAFLSEVRRGASARRRRRTTGVVAAVVLALAGVTGVTLGVRAADSPDRPPTSPSPSPTPLPDGAFRGVVDVVVLSPDVVFRLTSNDGCVGCSSVWVQNDGSGWIRLHDFGAEAYDGGDPATRVAVGPLDYLVMSPNGRNGWVWGRKLFSTHDGGVTWSEVTNGPGQPTDFGHTLGITDQYAWSLFRSETGTKLYRTPIDTDEWAEVDAPDLGGATDLITAEDTVALQTSDEGLAGVRLRTSKDGVHWGQLDLPCSSDTRVQSAGSSLFVLCPKTGTSGTVYRSTGLNQWFAFGSVSTQQDIHPLSADSVLVIEGSRKAVLLTPGAQTPVDLSAAPGAGFFRSSAIGDLCYLTSSSDEDSVSRLLRSADGGRTWVQVE